MAKIFVSYAAEDKIIAQLVTQTLRSAGFVVFESSTSLLPGGEIHEEINDQILNCNIFVFLISPDSVRRKKYTLSELKIACEKWPNPVCHILPVIIRNTDKEDIPACA